MVENPITTGKPSFWSCLFGRVPTPEYDSEPYGKVIKLSRAIKKSETTAWGVSRGSYFATKYPAEPFLTYEVYWRNKLKLGRHYNELIREKFRSRPNENTTKLYDDSGRDLDTYVVAVCYAGSHKISADFIRRDLYDQIRVIIHEDAHYYLRPTPPLLIDESFAEAISLHEGRKFAACYFRNEELIAGMNAFAEKRLRFFYSLRLCYDRLSSLYDSSLPDEVKLRQREPILAACSEEVGEEVNNAYLTFWATYFRFLPYALKKLERFGTKKFLEACRATGTEQYKDCPDPNEAWLHRFEEILVRE